MWDVGHILVAQKWWIFSWLLFKLVQLPDVIRSTFRLHYIMGRWVITACMPKCCLTAQEKAVATINPGFILGFVSIQGLSFQIYLRLNTGNNWTLKTTFLYWNSCLLVVPEGLCMKLFQCYHIIFTKIKEVKTNIECLYPCWMMIDLNLSSQWKIIALNCCKVSNIRNTPIPKTEMIPISSCSCLCTIHWSQVLSVEMKM